MLECSACVSRVLRSIAGDGRHAASLSTRPLILTPHLAQRPHRRRLATAVEVETPSKDALSGLVPVEKPTVEQFAQKRGGPILIANEKALRKELEYLKDPLKLADHVDYVLRCEQPDKALDLCRLASKHMNCIVSWNHVVAWNAHNGRPAKAIAIFNEMKKRGQFPDSYTYMRLLTALSESKEEVGKIVSIYHGMCSPSSKVKPNTSHTSAALRACSLAGDMDALWGIVSRLPEKGPNAPDAKVYTTILQAIKHNALGAEADVGLMEAQRQDAVNEGRRIWQEVISKWREGALMLDESLVVAMADLLLLSNLMQDRDNVLDLIHQTTGLERQIAPVGSLERRTGHVPVERPAHEEARIAPAEGLHDFTPVPSFHAFKPVTPAMRSDKSKRPQALVWVRPGNGILAMLIRVCDVMRTPKALNSYWDILTSAPHRVIPDPANFHYMLNVLRTNRSSVRASHVLQRMHDEVGVKALPMTYILAMRICARDRNNPNIIDIATDIVNDMEKHLHPLDMQTLQMYISLAQKTNNGPNIIEALNRVLEMEEKIFKSDPQTKSVASEHNAVAMDVYSAMRSAIDQLLVRNLIPKGAEAHWQEVRKKVDYSRGELQFGSKFRVGRKHASENRLGAKDARSGRMKAEGGDGHVPLPSREKRLNFQRPLPSHGRAQTVLRFGGQVRTWPPKRRVEKGLGKTEGFADTPGDLVG
ncbi:hypothetical protein CKM354_000101300 [Cercospora kikuchii]|uniref:Uncharacterized protein n=1 Tax=Cercospora kikuchii TaxID=84275 RepID=A0A9P3CCK8_9PEZI|nr:uncharacterized protein CKM354_000101300 [Cercospora kikuchii]GIZ37570.1 hypothetical protein CKM354_000101300 [Cercospora kikuchii]